MANKQPRFVNLQTSPVGVYTPEKRKVYVQPFINQKFSTAKTDVFVVEGEHYSKFVAPGGPLSMFPESAAVAAVSAPAASAPVAPVGTVPAGAVGHAKDAEGDADGDVAGTNSGAGGAGKDPAAILPDGDEGGAANSRGEAAKSPAASLTTAPKAAAPKVAAKPIRR